MQNLKQALIALAVSLAMAALLLCLAMMINGCSIEPTVEPNQKTVFVRELVAPDNYLLSDCEIAKVNGDTVDDLMKAFIINVGYTTECNERKASARNYVEKETARIKAEIKAEIEAENKNKK